MSPTQSEDNLLASWFIQLTTMQSCMTPINNNTNTDLTKFYAQKWADLLGSDSQKEQFRSCCFHNANTQIPDSDFSNATTFHDLLDQCYRPLSDAVLAVIRVSAITNDATLAATPFQSFGTVSAARAFPNQAAIDALCDRLCGDMDPYLLPGSTGETALRATIAKKGATLSDVVTSIV
ncbi:MAG: hypothetical protein ABSC05_18525 [Candidatus Solibacter sp.]|jgi:hypothetical protein